MYAKLQQHWYALPVLSGALLVLTFHPFNLWPLGFVALAPLYWFAGGFSHGKRIVYWGGFICGGIFSFFLSYYTIVQFHWLPEAYLFAGAVRSLVVPVTLIGGSVCGAAALAYRALRTGSFVRNALVAAALYTAAEIALGLLFGGYYLGLLAYAATPVPALLSLASLGGAHGVSFALALVNGAVAEALILRRVPWKAPGRAAGALLALSVLLLVANAAYLHRPALAAGAISVVVLQGGERATIPFGREEKGVFSWSMGERIAAAAADAPDLVIYPFSPVEGALYRAPAPAFNKPVLVAGEQSVGRFLETVLPAGTALMTWNNLYADGNFYNEYQLWQGGKVVSEYRKRALFPFMDYTPQWAQRAGFFSTPFDVVAGAPDNQLTLGSLKLGDLMCSELHNTALARGEAARAPLIIAVGSEAMFEDEVASAFSLKAAQLRAAENDIPVVRGNILGPSAIIDRSGRLIAFAPAGAEASIAADIALSEPRPTLYNLLGDATIWALICGILGSAWYIRSRAKTSV